MKKKLKLVALSGLAILVLTGCGRTDITGQSSGLWEQFVYGFAQIIHFLSFGGLVGLGIILFTLIIKTLLLPLMHVQTKSTRKMQEVQPELKKIQAQYPGKDAESKRIVAEKHRNFMPKMVSILIWAVCHCLYKCRFFGLCIRLVPVLIFCATDIFFGLTFRVMTLTLSYLFLPPSSLLLAHG